MKINRIKVLESVLKTYSKSSQPLYLKMPSIIVAWMALVILLVVLERLISAGEINIFLAMLITLLAGAAINFVVMMKASYQCRPYIKEYLDLDGIELEIEEYRRNA